MIFNRRTGENTMREFFPGHGREAIRERFVLERQHRGDPDIEVAVPGSNSIAEPETTHPRYFRSAQHS